MHSFLGDVFQALDEQGISYCLLRGYAGLTPTGGDREIDLLVAPRHLTPLTHILAARGFAAMPSWGHVPHHFFVAYEKENDAWIKFDVVTDLRYGRPVRAFRINLAESCLRQRRRVGRTYVLSPEDEFITLILHCLLDKTATEPGHRARLTLLREQLENDHGALERAHRGVQRYLAPAITWAFLTEVIHDQKWELLERRRAALARQLSWREPARSVWRNFSGRLLRRLRPLSFAANQRGLTIALLAPDGAGKTTLARQLAQEDQLRAHLIYMGTNLEASTVRLPTTLWLARCVRSSGDSRRRRLGGLLRGLNACNRLLEQWYRYGMALYHKLRGRVVVFDRYIYDSWLNDPPSTFRTRLPRWLLEAGCPTPDLVVLLDAPPDVLHSRKGEHTPEWLERQRCGYLALRDRIPHMVVVDATLEADEVRRTVTSLIWNRYSDRARKREAHACGH